MKSIQNKIIWIIGLVLTIAIANGCKTKTKKPLLSGVKLQHHLVEVLTNAIIHDIYSPPVASRLYAYSNLAYYEAIRPAYMKKSITNQLKGFDKLPEKMDGVHFNPSLAGITAFTAVAEKLIFSKDSIKSVRHSLLKAYDFLDESTTKTSIAWGEKVAEVILKRSAIDHYKITRGMPRYSVFNEAGKWQQTPPDYADATEPNWNKIIPLLMDSASQFKPPAPPSYSLDKKSDYYKELIELYDSSKKLTAEQKNIAKYWDDNPFVTEHKGHLTFANKKTTPVGHWMGITEILTNKANKNEISTAMIYALVSSAIFDGFIACWDEKYRSRTARPVTVIRSHIESEWNPLLQTPPFPEYPSGHSVISGAAATLLINEFGTNFAFHDTTELKYLGMERSFSSIENAMDEIGISRFYGGIHFMSAINNGKEQGIQIGNLFTKLEK